MDEVNKKRLLLTNIKEEAEKWLVTNADHLIQHCQNNIDRIKRDMAKGDYLGKPEQYAAAVGEAKAYQTLIDGFRTADERRSKAVKELEELGQPS